MCKRALIRFENALGPDHPSTLRTVFIIGRLYRKWDKMSETEALYPRALSDFEDPWPRSFMDEGCNL